MPSWFLHFWYGTLLVRLEGYSPERFLNLCSANQIELWDLQYVDRGYQFHITVRGYRKLKPLVKKTKVKLILLNKFGLPFFLFRNRKRKLLFAGIVSFFVVLQMMSLYIWDIHFEGNRKYTADIMQDFLDEQEIRYGMRKSLIDCDNLEDEIRSTFPDIIWVSARVTGTRLWIQVKENEVVFEIPELSEEPQDLVAEKAGTITGMIVRSGKAQVKIGDEVEKGQVLVSGAIPITNDAGDVVTVHYVHADADIHARTEYRYEKEVPGAEEILSETGRKRRGLRLRIGPWAAGALFPQQTEHLWVDVAEEHQARIFENFWLPLYADVITGKECMIYEKTLTDEEKKIMAERIHNQIMKKIMEKGVPIIENNVKILDNSLMFRVQGQMVLEEEITTGATITVQEELEQPDEHSGNDD